MIKTNANTKNNNNSHQLIIENISKYGLHKAVKWLFLGIFIIAPILINALCSFLVHDSIQKSLIIIMSLIALTTIGFSSIIFLHGGIVFRTPISAFLLFAFLMNIILVLLALFIGPIFRIGPKIPGTDDYIIDVSISTSLQLIGEIGCIILVLKWCHNLKNRIFNSLKNLKDFKKLLIFLVIILVSLAITYLINFLFNIIFEGIKNRTPSNQQAIDSFIKTIPGMILLIPFTAIIAPTLEELATREGIISVFGKESNNILWKIIGPIASILYFSNMHVEGDFQNIIFYIPTSICFVSIYLIMKKNVVYSIGLHMSWNIMTLIIMCVSLWKN